MVAYDTNITIITPCYNEDVVVIRFLQALEHRLELLPFRFNIVVVNDCSTDDTLSLLSNFTFGYAHLALHVINLKFNVGHQAAIYQGFLFAQHLPCDHVIVMDADGEDDPAVIPLLLQHMDSDIVHVVRSKRTESFFFRSCYGVYKALFKVVTGSRMNFGNFCLISRPVMELAVASSFTHLAAFLSRQNFSRASISAGKQQRIGGHSKMGFRKHMAHAIGSFAEYGVLLIHLHKKDQAAMQPIYEICTNANAKEAD